MDFDPISTNHDQNMEPGAIPEYRGSNRELQDTPLRVPDPVREVPGLLRSIPGNGPMVWMELPHLPRDPSPRPRATSGICQT